MEKHGRKMKAALVGCGQISEVYFNNIQKRFTNLEITACCAAHFESAQKAAAKYGIHACTYDEILEDPSIEIVLILTPAPTHYELVKKGILAGKHVYTEKTLALEVKDAKHLAELAEKHNVYLSAAPETFLGAAVQTAKKAIEDGRIGKVTSFHICANRDYDILSSLYSFLREPGGGICFDYGVYHLTALVELLGPVDNVFARWQNYKPVRKHSVPGMPGYGGMFDSQGESIAAAVLQMENGVTGTFMMNAESNMWDIIDFRIYGEEGVLILPDMNSFGGDVRLIPNTTRTAGEEIVLEPVSDLTGNCRGIGPSQMAEAIAAGTKSRVDSSLAIHVLDIVNQIITSGVQSVVKKIETSI